MLTTLVKKDLKRVHVRVILLFLLLASTNVLSDSIAQPVPVIAIEYPPYTSELVDGFGISFAALKARLEPLSLSFSPQFLPPPRAGKQILNGQWCLSFYPPTELKGSYKQVVLDKKPIILSFYRRYEEALFEWQSLHELAGKRVALLRTYSKAGIYRELKAAGLVIQEVNDLGQGFSLLAKKRVDFVFADDLGGDYILKQLALPKHDFQFAQTALSETYLHVWANLECAAAKKLAAAH